MRRLRTRSVRYLRNLALLGMAWVVAVALLFDLGLLDGEATPEGGAREDRDGDLGARQDDPHDDPAAALDSVLGRTGDGEPSSHLIADLTDVADEVVSPVSVSCGPGERVRDVEEFRFHSSSDARVLGALRFEGYPTADRSPGRQVLRLPEVADAEVSAPFAVVDLDLRGQVRRVRFLSRCGPPSS